MLHGNGPVLTQPTPDDAQYVAPGRDGRYYTLYQPFAYVLQFITIGVNAAGGPVIEGAPTVVVLGLVAWAVVAWGRRSGVAPAGAVAGAMLTCFGTVLWPMAAQGYDNLIEALALGMMLWAGAGEERRRAWLWAGLLLGLAFASRVGAGVLGVPGLVLVLTQSPRDLRAALRRGLSFALGCAPGIALVLWFEPDPVRRSLPALRRVGGPRGAGAVDGPVVLRSALDGDRRAQRQPRQGPPLVQPAAGLHAAVRGPHLPAPPSGVGRALDLRPGRTDRVWQVHLLAQRLGVGTSVRGADVPGRRPSRMVAFGVAGKPPTPRPGGTCRGTAPGRGPPDGSRRGLPGRDLRQLDRGDPVAVRSPRHVAGTRPPLPADHQLLYFRLDTAPIRCLPRNFAVLLGDPVYGRQVREALAFAMLVPALVLALVLVAAAEDRRRRVPPADGARAG